MYGDPTELPLTEEAPIGNCANPYGRTKYIGEMILQVGAELPPYFLKCILTGNQH